MLSPAELAALRQEYSQRGLRRRELDPDPVVQFNAWLAEAQARQIIEPNAMTLATVDADGQPWTREWVGIEFAAPQSVRRVFLTEGGEFGGRKHREI